MSSLKKNLNKELPIDLVKIDRTPFCQMHECETTSPRRHSAGSQALERFYWESCLAKHRRVDSWKFEILRPDGTTPFWKYFS